MSDHLAHRWRDALLRAGAGWTASQAANDMQAFLEVLARVCHQLPFTNRSKRGSPRSGAKLGSNLEPARRQVVWNLEQGLQLIERQIGLADQEVDSRELVLTVKPTYAVVTERNASLALPDSCCLETLVRQRQTEQASRFRIAWSTADLRREHPSSQSA